MANENVNKEAVKGSDNSYYDQTHGFKYNINKTKITFGDKSQYKADAEEFRKVWSTVYDNLSEYQKKIYDEDEIYREAVNLKLSRILQKREEEQIKKSSLSELKIKEKYLKQESEERMKSLEEQREVLLAMNQSTEEVEQAITAEMEERAKKQKLIDESRLEARKRQEYVIYDLELKNQNKITAGLTRAHKKAEMDAQEAESEYQEVRERYLSGDASEEELSAAKSKRDEANSTKEFYELVEKKLDDIKKGLDNTINEVSSTMTQYYGKMSSRLEGSGKTYNTISTLLKANFATNPFVKIRDVFSKVADLTDKGISYNVEMRAFLGTISENIASTFEIANGTLLKLIRLQQQDSSIARLGMESSLIQFLNQMYQNNEYMSDLFDKVSESLYEAESQLTTSMAAELEYAVQKWMGSLYSVGVSEDLITKLTQGLTYLGTGDYASLASNTSLQNLFAMAATRSGISYSDILLNGLSADTASALLEGVVGYLQEIATESSSQVVKSAYGNVFDFNLSDLTAVQNLTQDDVATIKSTLLSYTQQEAETAKELMTVWSDMPLQTKISNVTDNFKWTFASNIAESPALYAMYEIGSMLESEAGGIEIPGVMAAGFGLNNLGDIGSWLQVGAVGTSLLASIPEMLTSLGSTALMLNGGLSLFKGAMGYSTTTQRGSGFTSTPSLEVTKTQSYAQYTGTSSAEDIKSSIKQTATEESGASEEITSGEYQSYRSTEQLMRALVDPIGGDSMAVTDLSLSQALRSVDQDALNVYDLNNDMIYSTTVDESAQAIRVVVTGGDVQTKANEISINTANTVIVLTAILNYLTSGESQLVDTKNPNTSDILTSFSGKITESNADDSRLYSEFVQDLTSNLYQAFSSMGTRTSTFTPDIKSGQN